MLRLLTVLIQCKTFVPDNVTLPDFPSLIGEIEDRMSNKRVTTELARVGFQATTSFANKFHGLDQVYQVSKNTSNWRLLTSLQYYHANLILYTGFIVAYEESYVNNKQPLFDPRRSDFKQGHLKEITKSSCRIRDLKNAGERMLETVEYLVELAKDVAASQDTLSGTSTISIAPDQAQFTQLQLEIRGLCMEGRGCLSRLSTSLEHDIKFLGLRREMRQTNSVQRLTILATIFLTLSLSAGVLSMQTRFKDLGPLLYDFFGVVVLLGALVFPLLMFLSFLKIYTDRLLVDLELRSGSIASLWKIVRRIWFTLVWIGIAILATIALVSFSLGMFRDMFLGAKILGYGIAVFSFPMLSVLVPLWSFIFLQGLWKQVRKWREWFHRQGNTHQRGRDEEATRTSDVVAETMAPIELIGTPVTGRQAAIAPTGRAGC